MSDDIHRFYYAIAASHSHGADDEPKYIKMSEDGTLKVVSESSSATEFLWKMSADKASSFWGVKEERFFEVESCSEFNMLRSRQAGIEYNYQFQLQSLCNHNSIVLDGYNSFHLVDLPIFRYFLAFKSNDELYFFSHQSIDGKASTIELKKLRFVAETLKNGLETITPLQLHLQPIHAFGINGLHLLRMTGSNYKLSARTNNDNSTEISLLNKDKKDSFLIFVDISFR